MVNIDVVYIDVVQIEVVHIAVVHTEVVTKYVDHIEVVQIDAFIETVYRRLNGTSKVNRRTDGYTDRRTNRLTESIGPEGRCFENVILKGPKVF